MQRPNDLARRLLVDRLPGLAPVVLHGVSHPPTQSQVRPLLGATLAAKTTTVLLELLVILI